MSRASDYTHDNGQVLEKAAVRVRPPKRWRVVLYNDDFTPMDFVVFVLRRFFGHPEDRATRIMWQIHTEGKGVCGVYPREIAETKMVQVNQFSRQEGHPLRCQIEVHDE